MTINRDAGQEVIMPDRKFRRPDHGRNFMVEE